MKEGGINFETKIKNENNFEIPGVPTEITQALVALGYPKDVCSKLKIDDIDEILTNQTKF